MSTHKELATANTFNEKFKRALLDYYGYGFKAIPDDGTLSNDWNRLNNIIRDYVTWSSNRRETAFASADSQSMELNPFHRVFRFCGCSKTSDPMYFLHTLAILSNILTFRYDMEKDAYLNEDSIDEEAFERISTGRPLKTSDIAFLYTEMLNSEYLADRNRTPNNKLAALKSLGLLETQRRKEKGDHRWTLSPLTMERLIREGKKADTEFEQHLSSLVDFYSRSHLFGEIGLYLLDRMGNQYKRPFRIKHDYFTQALNDFNIIDLLNCIENGRWCRINYRHGVEGFKTELLCFPLQIRVSYANGREYMLYYEPFKRSASALRLEFIDSIALYPDKTVKETLVSTGYFKGENKINADISNARKSLSYTWGVSISKQQVGNAVKPIKPHTVSMRVAYDGDKEYYIKNRLMKEHRNGNVELDPSGRYIDFSASVADEYEMMPWVRSFYSRLTSCEGFEAAHPFSIKADVERTLSYMTGEERTWGIPSKALDALGKGTKAVEHEMLFNEIFSSYYYVLADVFVTLSSALNGVWFTEREINDLIKRSLEKYSEKTGAKTEQLLPARIKELILDCGILLKTKKDGKTAYQSRYRCASGTEFYRDIVPFSTVEVQWLKTIIEDTKTGYFMTPAEIAAVKDALDLAYPTIKPFSIDNVVFFDKYHYSYDAVERESKAFAVILDSINAGETLKIEYRTNLGALKKGEFKPIVLEFSKRDNRFQGYFQSCRNNSILVFNVDSIESILPTQTSFNREDALQALAEYRLQRKRSVEVEFYNVHNVADRILMEFAPWEKRCVYDEKNGLYKLTIYYQTDDEVALVIRLMGYGTEIRFVDREHSIYKEIIKRLRKQKELFKEKELPELEQTVEHDDR